MKSIRRLYFYLVTFISIEVVLWGLIALLRSMVDDVISGGEDALAQALALILVGVPIFLVHWLWAQRAAARDDEEQSAGIRAVFLYAILLATLIPVAQNILSFIDRSLVEVTGLGVGRAFRAFSEQTLADNLIAIVMNLIVAAYFWNVLRSDWSKLTDTENYSDVRRLYRYLWMLYGLLLTVFGAQQLLRFLFYIPGDVLGPMGREVAGNGIALLVVGTPIWIYSWRVIQDSLADPAEMSSTLRLIILYLLSLGGVITVITAAWRVVNIILNALLGQSFSLSEFIQEIGGPLSIGIPLGLVWAYFGYWLNRHIEAVGDRVRRAGIKRLYNYILAFIGLVVAFVGVATLLSFLIDMLFGAGIVITEMLRGSLASAISSVIVGLPLWLVMWRPMQVEAMAQGEIGDHARRSIIRKTYLYLALFASVIGGMAVAVGLVYNIIRVVLTGNAETDFVSNLLNLTQLLFLFGVVLGYHFNVLRADGASTADSLAERQNDYAVLVVDSGNGFVDSVKAALMRFAPHAPVTVTSPAAKPDGNFSALVLSGSLALDPPEWIRSFGGNRIVVQDEAKDLVWTDGAAQAAQSVQKLAEGEETQMQRKGRSPWMVVIYVFAALFALELLFLLLAFGISLIGR
ncbi:MAG TPA: DUF5671 domain-containing protein [Anaerolineales bacterium]|nr:DUF5671 domain-containing protein [Anaerolineales bacterium]